MVVSYDPQSPAEAIARGPNVLRPPWLVLLLGLASGGFLCFVGYKMV